MKRRIFSAVVSLLIIVVLYGWAWMPESFQYVKKGTANIYTTGFQFWAYPAATIMMIFVVYGAIKIGEHLYDYLRK